VLDVIREIKPPFSPDAVVQEYAALLKSYGIARVTGDAYAGEWPRERFAVHGISYDVSQKPKSAIYGEFLPALNGGRVRLLDSPRLVAQLVNLERRTARGGRDTIDHASGSHDDVANAACGALVRVIADRRPGLVRQDDLLTNNTALPLPTVCLAVFATLAISRDGIAAVLYVGKALDGRALIFDYSAGPLQGNLFQSIVERLLKLCAATRARAGGCIFAPKELVRQAYIAGLQIQEIPVHLDPEALLLPAAMHIASGKVKLCKPAEERARTSPFGGALDFRGGDGGDDPLRRAALWAISLALDQQ
jgi:hypothetical protein